MVKVASSAAGADLMGTPEVSISRADAEQLGLRIQEQAARVAEAECEFLLMVGEFDATDAVRFYIGLKSVAHWLAWACSMADGTAREHVRVARALRLMPLTVEEFGAGRLSYSKVREMSRIHDEMDEAALIELARAATASQLARMVQGYRAASGTRMGQEVFREASWVTRDDGMVEIRALLPAEEGAEVVAALDLAMQRGRDPVPEVDPDAPGGAHHQGNRVGNVPAGTPERVPGVFDEAFEVRMERDEFVPSHMRKADAVLMVARSFLDSESKDASGEDRHLVVVQVGVDALAEAGILLETPHTPQVVSHASQTVPDEGDGSVPAGTSAMVLAARLHRFQAHVVGGGPVEAATAGRLSCLGRTAMVITDASGEVLRLGRGRRLASPGQRRAVRLRDGLCQFPGCHQKRHLDMHHLRPWGEGGGTDLENLVGLCRRHHVLVHEGGLQVRRAPVGRVERFVVVDGEGREVQAMWPVIFERAITRPIDVPAGTETGPDIGPGIGHWRDDGRVLSPANGGRSDADHGPDRIASTTGGYGFNLHDCVSRLFAIRTPEPTAPDSNPDNNAMPAPEPAAA
jgi:hypothetical protein